MGIWWYPEKAFRNDNIPCPVDASTIFSMWGKGKLSVFRAGVIDICIVYVYSPFSIFLRYHYHIGQPFQVLDFSDEPRFQNVIYFLLNNLMSVRVEAPYSLSDRPGRQCDIQPMRSMRGANANHVRVGPGKYINVTKQNLPQTFFLFPGQEEANISVLIRPAQGY